MQNTDSLTLNAPSLPKGGGALTGLSGQMGAVGPDGAATLSVALPVSAGRGYAPSLGLNYSSQAGNGPFGMGWLVGTPSIQRRTRLGVPAYTPKDEFLAPNGEVLVPLLNGSGNPEISTRNTLLNTPLGHDYQVSAWRTRVEGNFSRYEQWQPADAAATSIFWVLYSPDGEVLLLGYEAQARLSDPAATDHTAQWLLNASVSASGEQIYYRWRAENDAGGSEEEKVAWPTACAQRYLSEVHYGNLTAARRFPCLNGAEALTSGWLFVLVFDYGERSIDPQTAPSFTATADWRCRQDCFTRFEYGFALRTRRLCHQVLMYHRLATLAGTAEGDDTPTLITRLLLSYEESASITTLQSVRQMAFDNSPPHSLLTLPPLDFRWQTFTPPVTADWQQVDWGNVNGQQAWQSVDLLGEGLAGLLYQDGGAWWYSAPERDTHSEDSNAVIWGQPQPLPVIPSLSAGAMLTDLNGDGRLQWVVSAAGVNGHYDPDIDRPGAWLHFTPLSALPVEYSHPRAQLADLTGSGFADLVLIGPRSVRLYTGKGDHWSAGQTVIPSDGIVLPVPEADARTLVAFSDPLGSGQQHLVQIRADGITCWPNLGKGRFGQPLTLPGFSQPTENFNPDRVLLADTDGSGATDVIYLHGDRLEIYRNLSGNGFAAPINLPLPDGVRYDHTCTLQVADVQGLGVASLLLTVPHISPTHYVLHLATEKPWLINGMNNNMGAVQTFCYRSSAQFWLDEKASVQARGETAPSSYLPFPLHCLWRTETTDEITGNRLVSRVSYRHGAWDGREREFRGFGSVNVWDTEQILTDAATPLALPSLIRSWYATGIPAIDRRFAAEYWAGDRAAFPGFSPRFTTGSGNEETLYPQEVAGSEVFWLTRAQKGILLRSEVFGLDGSMYESVPYSVTEQRLQVRLISDQAPYPVVWPSVVESRQYHYERISEDPQCAQQITLSSDAAGQPLRQVSVNYPRRPRPSVNPYPETLPETLFASSYDPQQQCLRLTQVENRWHHLTSRQDDLLILGLPDAVRSDHFTTGAENMPQTGLNLEVLTGSGNLLTDETTRVFGGQQQTWWHNEQGQPSTGVPAFPPREVYTDSSQLDEMMVQQLAAQCPAVDFPAMLTTAGYLQMDYLFARPNEQGRTLWSVRSGTTNYGDLSQFWRPLAYRESPLTGKNQLTWDPHFCAVIRHQDAAGLTVSAQYDWRFLAPITLTDINDNVQKVTLDALGRVTSQRFSGTEAGQTAGYSDVSFLLPGDANDALALHPPLPVAQCYVFVADSWMKDGMQKMPPHTVVLTTDRYDSDPEQQIRQQVVLSDGFGRTLQAAVRHENGEAWQRTEEGSLLTDGQGPIAGITGFRWAVSGRVEYDNKGQPVRQYQPYFLNDWRYVSDDSARQDLYADTHYYDPAGREWQVKTAKGMLRRSLVTPWFMVSEDENDTAAEITNVI